MLAKIIISMCVGQLLAVLLIVFGFLVRFLGALYCALMSYFMQVHKRDSKFILFLRNKEEFMEWKKERDQHE